MALLRDWSKPAFAGAALTLSLVAPRALAFECRAPRLHLALPQAPDWAAAAEDLEWRLRRSPSSRPMRERERFRHFRARDRGRFNLGRPPSKARESRVPRSSRAPSKPCSCSHRPERSNAHRELASARIRPAREASAAATRQRGQCSCGCRAAARLGGPALYVGAGLAVFAAVGLSGWELNLGVRWDMADLVLSDPTPDGFNMDSEAIQIALGRAWSARGAELELLVGPTVVFESQDVAGSDDLLGGETTDVRIDAMLRGSLPRNSAIRFFGAADFEVSPSRLAHPRQFDAALPTLPSFSAGLTAGVLWQSR